MFATCWRLTAPPAAARARLKLARRHPVAEADAEAARGSDEVVVEVDVPVVRDRVADGNGDDVVAAEGDHVAELPLGDQVDHRDAVAGGEEAVHRDRDSAALDVAEDATARVLEASHLELVAEPAPDAAQDRVRVARLALLHGERRAAERERALGDDDDREVVAGLPSPLDVQRDVVDLERNLGDEDRV